MKLVMPNLVRRPVFTRRVNAVAIEELSETTAVSSRKRDEHRGHGPQLIASQTKRRYGDCTVSSFASKNARTCRLDRFVPALLKSVFCGSSCFSQSLCQPVSGEVKIALR